MINFGFDDLLIVDENGNMDVPYPNAYNKELYWFDMDVYRTKYGDFPILNKNIDRDDYIFLNGRSICVNLNNDLYSYRKDTVDNYIKDDESFIYPILIWNNDLFKGEADLVLSDKVKEQIRLNKCKLVIFYITEPWFMHEYCYVWMSNFSKQNDLNKDNFILVSSNLISPEVKDRYVSEGIIENNFSIIEFNYFFHRLWFNKDSFHRNNSHSTYQNLLRTNLKKQKETKKEKHFLCFNRKPHDHRIAIFSEVMTNPKLRDKFIITLGCEDMINGQKHSEGLRRYIDASYKHGNQRLYDFIDNYNSGLDYIYDTNDLVDEQSGKINIDAHCKTFCNVVTETQTTEDLIFFSEKIIKPIFALQPFIIFGNRNSLKKLKEYGFKTFDKWWDESYDELKYQNRFERIVEILEDISMWDDDKVSKTLEEMESTLIHNFNMLLEDKSTTTFFTQFIKKTKITNKKLI
jgi:hypothetical protein